MTDIYVGKNIKREHGYVKRHAQLGTKNKRLFIKIPEKNVTGTRNPLWGIKKKSWKKNRQN